MTRQPDTVDEPGTILPDAEQEPTRPSIAARLVKVVLALALGLGAGWGIQQGVAWWQAKGSGNPVFAPTSPAFVQSSPVTEIPLDPMSAQAFSAWLVLGTQAHSLEEGQISLPSGTRFQIRIQSPVAGKVSVSAVNPAGEASGAPLWRGSVGVGKDVLSPVLRLEGAKGRETLVVVIQPLNGQAPIVRNLHLWHL